MPDFSCDVPKPGGKFTNRQLKENSWISGDSILNCYVPFTRIHNLEKKKEQSLLCMGNLIQNRTCTIYNHMTDLGPKYNDRTGSIYE